MQDKRSLFIFVVAIVVGASFFRWQLSPISPASDLWVSLVSLDTDLGMTSYAEAGGLAEVTTWSSTQIWADPDLQGEEQFTVSAGILSPIGLLKGSDTFSVSRAYCQQPDIVVTITEPVPVLLGKEGTVQINDIEFTLYKTSFEILFKTAADSYADTVVAEIAHKPNHDLGLAEVQVTPPVGKTWEGNVIVDYQIKNHPGAFIHEAYINKDPKALPVSGIPTLEAGAIPAVALAPLELADALDVQDGKMQLGAQLGVGADPIIKDNVLLPDEFKGWNLYDTYVQYQVAVVVAIPEGEQIQGSTRDTEQGDPQYYRTTIQDVENWLADIVERVGPVVGGITDVLKLLVIAFLAAVVVFVVLKVGLALFAVRRVTR